VLDDFYRAANRLAMFFFVEGRRFAGGANGNDAIGALRDVELDEFG
jgi:hypothetical protein